MSDCVAEQGRTKQPKKRCLKLGDDILEGIRYKDFTGLFLRYGTTAMDILRTAIFLDHRMLL